MATKSINLTNLEQEQIMVGQLPPSVIKKVETLRKPKAARYSKSKGAATQKEAAQWVADLLDIEWDNTDDDSPIQTRSMGLAGVDLVLRGKAKELFIFDVEVKAVESLSVPATIQQAESNTGKNRYWLIYWKKKSFNQPVIIVSRGAFDYLFKRGINGKQT